MPHLDVLGDDLALGAGDEWLGIGARLQPEGDQPADEDDPCLQEALLGAVEWLRVGLPAHHAVVGLGPHGRHIYTATQGDYKQKCCQKNEMYKGFLLVQVPAFFQDEKKY